MNFQHKLGSRLVLYSLYLICALLASIFLIVMIRYALITPETPEDTTVYMICDVYDVVLNGEIVEIDMILPNGDLLTRQMSINDDLPEGFSEIIIETSNLDDYSTYRVVGMR